MKLACDLLNIALILSVSHLALSSSDSGEVIGCGGFVKSNTEINFKIIQVPLPPKLPTN